MIKTKKRKYTYEVIHYDPCTWMNEFSTWYYDTEQSAVEAAKKLLKAHPLSRQGTLTIEKKCILYTKEGK
jgi:hypothetical protein